MYEDDHQLLLSQALALRVHQTKQKHILLAIALWGKYSSGRNLIPFPPLNDDHRTDNSE